MKIAIQVETVLGSLDVCETLAPACIWREFLDSEDFRKASHSWPRTAFSLSFSLRVQVSGTLFSGS